MEEEDRVVTHLGAEAKTGWHSWRVRDWEGTLLEGPGFTGSIPTSSSPLALSLFPGVEDSWILKSLCLFLDPNGEEKRQHKA